jgi:GNAT superfamily N-acetyltransferase
MAQAASQDVPRAAIRALLDERSPVDALASYYALHAAPERTHFAIHTGADGRVDGFLARARTGMDLFRPLVTLRAPASNVVEALLREGLVANQPNYLTVPESLAVWVNKYLSVTDAEIHHIYQMDAARHTPLINVLLTTSDDGNGGPRCEIRSGGQLGAVAGVNWQSPRFAEIYVYTDPAVRGRGWGKAVVSTLAGRLLETGRTPLYVVAESNDYSIRLAEAAGFVDTGFREYVGHAVRIA